MASNRELLALLLERERRRARDDLYTFSRWMFRARKGYAWQEAAHHALICDALMRVFRGEITRLVINVPPRYSKTELAVVNFIAWALGKVPDAEFIHGSYSGTLAGNNSAGIRDLMLHQEYRQIFDTRLATEGQQHWKTTDGGVMYAAGAGGTITGFGAGKMREGFGGAIIIDDPHKADEAASDKIREGVITWFQNTLESRKNDPLRTPIIVIMQRLHGRDLAGWLLGDRGPDMQGPPVAGGNGEVWHHLCLDVWQKDADGAEVPLWPEKHDAETLRRMERASPYVFAGQYRQRPAPPTGGVIKPDLIPIVDAVPANVVQWARGWDFGASTSGDYTVGFKIGKMADGRFVIADIRRERMETADRDNLIKNTADGDGKGRVKQSMPQDPGAAGKAQVRYLSTQLAGHTLHWTPESGDKVTRADPFASQINVGNVVMVRGPWNDEWKDEARLFPNGQYDDQVDAGSRAFNALLTSASGLIT
jgi:predicted phage terminase large subunit-like protein